MAKAILADIERDGGRLYAGPRHRRLRSLLLVILAAVSVAGGLGMIGVTLPGGSNIGMCPVGKGR